MTQPIGGKRPVNTLSQQENERIINETIRRLKHQLPGIIAGAIGGIIAAGGGPEVLTDDDGNIIVDDNGQIVYAG